MTNGKRVLFFIALFMVSFAGAAYITIYDGIGDPGENEDGTTEPGMVNTQRWDLEAFELNGASLSMLGGYNFHNTTQTFPSGDIFLDIDGDAEYGRTAGTAFPPNGNVDVTDTYGYDYVLDLDWNSGTYDVIDLTAGQAATVTTGYYGMNYGSNPWAYKDGGASLLKDQQIGYVTGLTDAETGLSGGYHNKVTVDLSFLKPGTGFISHYTMKCGNDNLMGQGVLSVPEPGAWSLMALGILGVCVYRRKKA